jgi:hypothetical protein
MPTAMTAMSSSSFNSKWTDFVCPIRALEPSLVLEGRETDRWQGLLPWLCQAPQDLRFNQWKTSRLSRFWFVCELMPLASMTQRLWRYVGSGKSIVALWKVEHVIAACLQEHSNSPFKVVMNSWSIKITKEALKFKNEGQSEQSWQRTILCLRTWLKCC